MTIRFTGRASDFLKIGVAAAARGDVDSVREILKLKPKWKNRPGSHGRTMLWEASHRGCLEMVKYLVRRRANIDACGSHYTPYFVEISCYCIARHKRHHEVAEFLLEKGAIVDIHTAAFLGDLSAIKKFLKRKPKLLNAGHDQHEMGKNLPDGNDVYPAYAEWATPLCYALRGGDVETVEYLIGRGAKIEGFDDQLFTAADDDVDKIRLLLENGADVEFGPEPLPDDAELFKLMTSYGYTLDSSHHDNELVYLCRGDRGGNVDELKRLLKFGANVNHRDHHGKTALHRAAKSGFIETMQVLLDHGADVSIEDAKGETPLFEAVRSTIKKVENLKQAIRLLLKHGADPKHVNARRQTLKTVAKKADRFSKTQLNKWFGK